MICDLDAIVTGVADARRRDRAGFQADAAAKSGSRQRKLHQTAHLQTARGRAFIRMTALGLWVLTRRARVRLSQTAEVAIKAEDRLRLALTAAGGLVWLASVFEPPFDLGGFVVHVTVSMGLSTFPGDATSCEELWLTADLAIYEAKARGRNLIVPFTAALRDRQAEEARTAQALQHALKARGSRSAAHPQLRAFGR